MQLRGRMRARVMTEQIELADVPLTLDRPGAAPGTATEIQPHAALLALDSPDLRIVRAGGDTQGLLGTAPHALIGETAAFVLAPDQVARLRGLAGPGRLPARKLLVPSPMAAMVCWCWKSNRAAKPSPRTRWRWCKP